MALLLAVIWTWPLARDLGGSLPFDPREGAFRDSASHQGPWSLWHAWQSASNGSDPFQAAELGPPHGHGLAREEHGLAIGLLALPLTATVGALSTLR